MCINVMFYIFLLTEGILMVPPLERHLNAQVFLSWGWAGRPVFSLRAELGLWESVHPLSPPFAPPERECFPSAPLWVG